LCFLGFESSKILAIPPYIYIEKNHTNFVKEKQGRENGETGHIPQSGEKRKRFLRGCTGMNIITNVSGGRAPRKVIQYLPAFPVFF
jgi:gamma-glutamyl-gamma-aminobutyrate hydrolase PuuD